MTATINSFDDDAIRRIAGSVERLSAQHRNLRDMLLAVRREAPGHAIRTGKTVAPEGGAYPATGCIFRVRFQDWDWPEVVATCERELYDWPDKHVIAQTYDESHVAEDTEVILVKIPGRKGRRWYILPTPTLPGIISFKMLTDRTREKDQNGLLFGKADVEITDKAGTIPDNVGDTVEVIFADSRWLESITDCYGLAEYIDGAYYVYECQGKAQGFWFVTLEDRQPGGGEQDVKVVPIKSIGHAQDDLPVEQTNPPQQGQVDCGYVEYTYTAGPNGNVWAQTDISNWNPCCYHFAPGQSGSNETFPANPQLGQTYISNGGLPLDNCEPPAPESDLKVRYLAGTYPRMLKGAIGYAQLDNDISNETDNSTMRYYVVVSDQATLRITSSLSQKMCGTEATVNDVEVSGFFPFSQKPRNVTTIPNPYGHYGMAGDKIAAEWNQAIENYEVVDVDKHPEEVTVGLSKTTEDGCTTIKYSKVTAALEYCEAPSEETLLQYRNQTVTDVTGLRLDKGQTGSGSGTQCSPRLVIDITQYEGFVLCDDPTPTEWAIDLVTQDVVADINWSGCPSNTDQVIIVIGLCGDESNQEADCDDCDESSGSGSGQ